jgi:hypothetical protein
MGLFTQQSLKASQGQQEILRFFALASSLFALHEKVSGVPGTPTTKKEILREMSSIDDKVHILNVLSAIRVATVHMDETRKKGSGYCLLMLDHSENKVSLRFFRQSQIDIATRMYSEIEDTRDETRIDAVLVSTTSFDALKVAYPNYFSDIGEFVAFIEKAVSNVA